MVSSIGSRMTVFAITISVGTHPLGNRIGFFVFFFPAPSVAIALYS